jgi:hypothetical protein
MPKGSVGNPFGGGAPPNTHASGRNIGTPAAQLNNDAPHLLNLSTAIRNFSDVSNTSAVEYRMGQLKLTQRAPLRIGDVWTSGAISVTVFLN